ncbi:NAD(P)-dependent dehydrogenase (short-subunit alcohol dehydrogenase family) [Tamaricihabitans halophyticus]|uniref:NAD(P)-dependent dehydrogenase (Short-subunit alcohol dehydrogenase family) n=1 Tax=Tamaricihabitans halophyticus TaxID=1262583 RepID=A0A4R2R348_9PSEU|nr:SDR family oxidoreductase [Tamaricihabitans halophyticus]TCP57220.1 NAD(P)-dependent dehydrogenase (short-subunit alcohol dehydrogenase family) [Tamaricihabitans halophyticus]
MAGTLIVTGGSRGIGAAIARAAAGEFAVLVNYSGSADRAQDVVAEIEAAGGRAAPFRADVSNEDEVLAMFAAAEELGPLAGLVNNAGITGGMIGKVVEWSAADVRRTLEVNVLGTFMCAKEAVRRMSTSNGGSGGVIVNISSTAAQRGSAGEWVHYAGSKAAVEAMTVGLAQETGPEGIRVNCVAPGAVATELHAASGEPGRVDRLAPLIPLGRAGLPEEIAAGVSWLLSPAASYVTGAVLTIGGGR